MKPPSYPDYHSCTHATPSPASCPPPSPTHPSDPGPYSPSGLPPPPPPLTGIACPHYSSTRLQGVQPSWLSWWNVTDGQHACTHSCRAVDTCSTASTEQSVQSDHVPSSLVATSNNHNLFFFFVIPACVSGISRTSYFNCVLRPCLFTVCRMRPTLTGEIQHRLAEWTRVAVESAFEQVHNTIQILLVICFKFGWLVVTKV